MQHIAKLEKRSKKKKLQFSEDEMKAFHLSESRETFSRLESCIMSIYSQNFRAKGFINQKIQPLKVGY